MERRVMNIKELCSITQIDYNVNHPSYSLNKIKQNYLIEQIRKGDYKIVRIVSNHIINDEQFSFDMFKTKHIVKKIKRKTLSLSMNVLSIFTV